ncbi:MAG TPA: lysine--tRNA ligase [Kiritimatiellia bacterium]|nr:lysine--tRNA ligase [Kiritimatiellia bacterium]HRZ12392.1 lysine--tRNA ligase [Kiritimatiellia bacterium]HSA17850.1 lysine--tRNA ligase [Kiritimatiellia bacterium]
MDQGPRENEFRQQRIENMCRLQSLGYEPFGTPFERTGRLAEILAAFAEQKPAKIAGRIVSKRQMGKSIFAHLQDGAARLQVYVKKDAVGEKAFEAFELLDLGDQIGAEGELFVTRTGEQSLKVNAWTLLSKALLPLPEKWHGLHDVEMRYRYRYLDLIANPEVRSLFDRRTQAIAAIRKFLSDRGFSEVETPMIQAMAGGATANPFKTHYHALGHDMFLRIAPELYLKRLLVGGYDKVFELNRNFRNEGLDRSHNPEFTMLEIYEAYTDVRGMMRLVQDLVTHVAQTVFGALKVGSVERPYDLALPWPEKTYRELILEKAGADWFDLDLPRARERAQGMGLAIAPEWAKLDVTHEIYEKLVEKSLAGPVFVTRFPAELIPLAKPCADDPTTVDVFELVMQGREIAPAYSELNDPLEQRRRLEAQAKGDESKVDHDFLTALEHGMPPAGGMGIGIDRLLMVLTGAEAIRDVILFPQLKPKT